MNPDDRNTYNREVRQEIHPDPESNAPTRVTQTTESVRAPADEYEREAYRDGYARGRMTEHYRQAENREYRDSNTAVRSLLIGIILTSLVGLVAGAVYYLSQRNESVEPTTEIVPVPSPNPTQTIERERTIIERQAPAPQQSPVERIIPIPVPQNSPTPAATPDINITVPNTQRQEAPSQPTPAPQNSPATAPDININVPNSRQEDNSGDRTPAFSIPQPDNTDAQTDTTAPGDNTDASDRNAPANNTGANGTATPDNSTDANGTAAPGGNTDTGAGDGSAP